MEERNGRTGNGWLWIAAAAVAAACVLTAGWVVWKRGAGPAGPLIGMFPVDAAGVLTADVRQLQESSLGAAVLRMVAGRYEEEDLEPADVTEMAAGFWFDAEGGDQREVVLLLVRTDALPPAREPDGTIAGRAAWSQGTDPEGSPWLVAAGRGVGALGDRQTLEAWLAGETWRNGGLQAELEALYRRTPEDAWLRGALRMADEVREAGKARAGVGAGMDALGAEKILGGAVWSTLPEGGDAGVEVTIGLAVENREDVTTMGTNLALFAGLLQSGMYGTGLGSGEDGRLETWREELDAEEEEDGVIPLVGLRYGVGARYVEERLQRLLADGGA